MEVIHIYHTNDLHSHFENWPRISELLRERKQWHEEEGDSFFLFDIGDHLDLSHPFTEATQGKINTELLDKEHYHAVTIGNNEGITLPHEALDTLYDKASFDVIIANLFAKNGERPSWSNAYKIYNTKSGTKIGVIGLTAYYESLYNLLDWNITDPYESLAIQLKELQGKADIIVLLSHLGINDDELIASRFPEIDVILGAHTHHVFHQGKEINNCLLGAAGKFGYFVGHIVLTVDPLTKEIEKRDAIVYDTSKLPPALKEKEITENLYQQGKKILSETVVTLEKSISAPFIADILCKELVTWCDADCAIINEGLILDNLSEGNVTYFDLLSICPHPINPCVVQLTGAELKEILLDMEDEKWEQLQLKGLGFRGTLMGKMISSGITWEMDGEIKTYYIQSQALNPTKEYRVTVPDMFTFGNFFPAIFRAKKKTYFLPEFMRNILAHCLKSKYSF